MEGLGSLRDFEPHDRGQWPAAPGIYLFYDVSQRLIYIGQSGNVKSRLKQHYEKFWYRPPIVESASYIEIEDEKMRKRLESLLIKSLGSHAVINHQGVDRGD